MERILKASRLLLVEYLVLMLLFRGIDPLSGMSALLAIFGVEIYFLNEKRKVSNLPLICVLVAYGGILTVWLMLKWNPPAGPSAPAAMVVFLPIILVLVVLPFIAYIIFALYDLSGKFEPEPAGTGQPM